MLYQQVRQKRRTKRRRCARYGDDRVVKPPLSQRERRLFLRGRLERSLDLIQRAFSGLLPLAMAERKSRFSRAMNSTLISLGHAASHSR